MILNNLLGTPPETTLGWNVFSESTVYTNAITFPASISPRAIGDSEFIGTSGKIYTDVGLGNGYDLEIYSNTSVTTGLGITANNDVATATTNDHYRWIDDGNKFIYFQHLDSYYGYTIYECSTPYKLATATTSSYNVTSTFHPEFVHQATGDIVSGSSPIRITVSNDGTIVYFNVQATINGNIRNYLLRITVSTPFDFTSANMDLSLSTYLNSGAVQYYNYAPTAQYSTLTGMIAVDGQNGKTGILYTGANGATSIGSLYQLSHLDSTFTKSSSVHSYDSVWYGHRMTLSPDGLTIVSSDKVMKLDSAYTLSTTGTKPSSENKIYLPLNYTEIEEALYVKTGETTSDVMVVTPTTLSSYFDLSLLGNSTTDVNYGVSISDNSTGFSSVTSSFNSVNKPTLYDTVYAAKVYKFDDYANSHLYTINTSKSLRKVRWSDKAVLQTFDLSAYTIKDFAFSHDGNNFYLLDESKILYKFNCSSSYTITGMTLDSNIDLSTLDTTINNNSIMSIEIKQDNSNRLYVALYYNGTTSYIVTLFFETVGDLSSLVFEKSEVVYRTSYTTGRPILQFSQDGQYMCFGNKISHINGYN